MERTIGKETVLPIGSRAKIRNVWWTPHVYCKKYEGKFTQQGLQDLADTNLWVTGAAGMPEAIRGEGHNHEFAIKDAIARNVEMVSKLQRVVLELRKALDEVISQDTNHEKP